MKAREKEMGQFRKHVLYESGEEGGMLGCHSEGPIGARWISTRATKLTWSTSPDVSPNKFNITPNEDDIFAATPPLEAQKLAFSIGVAEGIGFQKGAKREWVEYRFCRC